jgi:hypothetical protein
MAAAVAVGGLVPPAAVVVSAARWAELLVLFGGKGRV